MSKCKNIIITKAPGEKASFVASKLRQSLKKAGTEEKGILQIASKIEGSLYNGITTKEIYNKAFALLRKAYRPAAARYKLKKAIYVLGSTGFPSEKFVSAIINYEVDEVAEKKEKHFMVGCKFHSDQGKHGFAGL